MTMNGYGLKVISGPDCEPISLIEAATQCKLDPDLLQDENVTNELNRFIAAARLKAEEFCECSFVERVYELTLSNFPRACDEECIRLPMGPVIELLGVSYLGTDGNPINLTPLDKPYEESRVWYLRPKFGTYWPYVYRRAGAVSIQYRAGYPSAGSPADAVKVPPLAKQAMLTLIAHFNENREAVIAETRIAPVQVPETFYDLLQPFKVY